MKNENIVATLGRLMSEATALSEGKTPIEIGEDPRICGLMVQVESIIEELEQIVETAFPNHPEKVALWKKVLSIDVDDDEIE